MLYWVGIIRQEPESFSEMAQIRLKILDSKKDLSSLNISCAELKYCHLISAIPWNMSSYINRLN